MESPHYGNCRWAGKPGHTVSGASRACSSRSARELATRLIALTFGAAAPVRVIHQEFVMLLAFNGWAWKPRHFNSANSCCLARRLAALQLLARVRGEDMVRTEQIPNYYCRMVLWLGAETASKAYGLIYGRSGLHLEMRRMKREDSEKK